MFWEYPYERFQVAIHQKKGKLTPHKLVLARQQYANFRFFCTVLSFQNLVSNGLHRRWMWYMLELKTYTHRRLQHKSTALRWKRKRSRRIYNWKNPTGYILGKVQKQSHRGTIWVNLHKLEAFQKSTIPQNKILRRRKQVYAGQRRFWN